MLGDKYKVNAWTTIEEIKGKKDEKKYSATIELVKVFQDKKGEFIFHKAVKVQKKDRNV